MSTTAALRPIPVIANSQLRAPKGGFRTATLRDKKIIAYIDTNPGLTIPEYADRLDVDAIRINDCILFTREGRQLAERALVYLPARGRPPFWYKLLFNRGEITKRVRENQYPMVAITGVENPEILGRTLSAMSLTRSLIMKSSRKQRRQIIEGVDAEVKASAVAHAVDLSNMQMLIEQATSKATAAATKEVLTKLNIFTTAQADAVNTSAGAGGNTNGQQSH